MRSVQDHDIHDGTAWDKEDLAQFPDNSVQTESHCHGGLWRWTGRPSKTEYSTLDQFQKIRNMLGENAVCKLVTL